MVEQFIQELTKVGGTVYRAEDKEDIYLYLAEFAKEKKAKLIVRGKLTDFNEERIDRILRHYGMEVFLTDAGASAKDQGIMDRARKRFRERIINAHMGINAVDYGIAETGTLVFFTMEGQPRLISALPPIHVAMMKVEKLVTNWNDLTLILKDYLIPPYPPLLIPPYPPLLKGGKGGLKESCITFITGPSRTADIELSLTIGVHGPRELHVILHP